VTWVSWRLQRTETLVALAIVALLAALLVPTGLRMEHVYTADHLSACLAGSASPACDGAVGAFEQRFSSVLSLADWFTLLPGVIGVLLAAPFVGDLERGTYRLVWTQGITRGRWLRGKLALAAVTAAIAAGSMSLLCAWWRRPDVRLHGRLETGTYDTTGCVAVGYALFALGLTLALGAVWRRAAASIAVAFVAYFAARIYVDTSLRDRLVAPLHTSYRGARMPRFLEHARMIDVTGRIGGHVIGGSGDVHTAAPAIRNTLLHVTYQPDSHFWPLQLAETGLFAGAAAMLIAFAAWWTLRRAA
jgi:hypothetical protein